jgi:hypothetical protein
MLAFMRRITRLAGAVLLFAAFWVTSWACNFFSDAPYLIGPAEMPGMIGSSRYIALNEAGLMLTAAILLWPAIALVALALCDRASPFERILEAIREDERVVPVIAATVAIAGAAFVSYALIDKVDLIDDERAYLFQAQLFAHGRIADPGLPAAFRNQMFITQPIFAAKYPPGNSVLLALGVLVHQPHIIHPLLAGVTAIATYAFVKSAFGPKQAMLAAAFVAISPWVWCTDGTLMAFGGAAACVALLLAGVARASKGSALAAALAGAAVGALVTIRYFEGAILAVAVGIWVVYLWVSKSPSRWPFRFALFFVATAALGGIAALAFNHALTGSFWKTGYALESNPVRLGFVRSFTGAYKHTFPRGVTNDLTNLMRIDSWLLGLPGALVLIAVGLIRKGNAFDVLLRIAFALFFAAYVVVPGPGTWDVGPTYMFLMLPVFVSLAVRGAQAIRVTAGERARLVDWSLAVYVALGVITVTPLRLYRVEDVASAIQSPWDAVASSDATGALIVPNIRARAAAGWGYGYPYEIDTHAGRVKLMMPVRREEYDEAMQFLGAKTAFTLQLDRDHFVATDARRFQVVPFDPDLAWPAKPH